MSVTKLAVSSEKTSFNEGGRQTWWSQLDSAVIQQCATLSTENVPIVLELRGKSTDYFQIILVRLNK